MAETNAKPQQDTHRVQQFSLTAWELEKTAVETEGAERRSEILMRTQERLQAEMERWDEIDPAKRSQIRIHPDAEAAVLLIHGSTGNPQDLRGLTDHVFERGFTAANILLPGHGYADDALPDVQWRACYNEVQMRYRILAAAYEKVHVVGFSFGGALALHLARAEQPADLVLLSTALNPKVALGTRILISLGLHRLGFVRRRVGWNMQVFDCMEKAKGVVGKLRLPVYAAHCEDDERIDPSSLRFLQKKIRHRSSRFRLFQNGGHMILDAHGRDGLHAEILDFLSRR